MFHLNHWKTKTKLLVLAGLPLLAILGLSAVQIWQSYSTYGEMSRLEKQIGVVVAASAIVHESQRERGRTAGFLASQGQSFQSEIREQCSRTDKQIVRFHQVLKESGLMKESTAFGKKSTQIQERLKQFTEIRQKVDSLSIPTQQAIGFYTGSNRIMLSLVALTANSATEPSLKNKLTTLFAHLQRKERSGIERAVLSAVFALGKFQGKLLENFVSLLSAKKVYRDMFLSFGGTLEKDLENNISQDRNTQRVKSIEKKVLARKFTGNFGISPDTWFPIVTGMIDTMYTAENSLVQSIQEKIKREAGASLTNLILVSSLLALLLLTLIFLSSQIGRNFTSRLAALARDLSQIAAGDLRLEIGRDGNDEIGDLRNDVNSMVEHLRRVVGGIQVNAEKVREAAGQMLENSKQVSAGMEETSEKAREIDQLSQEMDSAMQMVAGGMEEMSLAIEEVSRKSNETARLAGDVSNEARQTDDTVRQLSDNARQINTVTESIVGFASQTNLLALNAAIEAAVAGEAGRGFAVVAGEVKELARQSGESSEDIQEKIKLVLKSIAVTIRAVATIVDNIEKVNDQNRTISSAVEEQSIAVRELTENISKVSQVTTNVTKNMEIINRAAADSARQTESNREQADQLLELARLLNREVAHFKTGRDAA